MSNDNAKRTTRTNGAAPMGSTVAIVVTAIAVILAFLILRKVNDDTSEASTSKPDATSAQSSTTLDGAVVTQPTVPPTTEVVLVTIGTKVQVANASTQNGVAKQMSDVLGTKGFSMAVAVSASVKLPVSKVLYKADDPAAKPVADSLAALFGGIAVEAQGVPVPAGAGAWAEGSSVILLLGDDFAGKTLAQINGEPTTGTTTPPTATT